MAIKAVVLARKNGDGADVVLPRTSADLVGYEKENSTATNVKEALDEINDNFQGEAPGIVRRVEVLEANFMPKTGGTFTGLVSVNEGILLGDGSASEIAEYSKIIYGNVETGSIASRVGRQLADNTPFLDWYFLDSTTRAVTYSLNYNFATATLRGLLRNDNGEPYTVSLPLSIAPKNNPSLVGYFAPINQLHGPSGFSLPSGGTYAVYILFGSDGGAVMHSAAGIFAGGNTFTHPNANANWTLRGFYWRLG